VVGVLPLEFDQFLERRRELLEVVFLPGLLPRGMGVRRRRRNLLDQFPGTLVSRSYVRRTSRTTAACSSSRSVDSSSESNSPVSSAVRSS